MVSSEVVARPLVAAFDTLLGVRRAAPLNERRQEPPGPWPDDPDALFGARLSRLLEDGDGAASLDYGRLASTPTFREYVAAASWLATFDPAELDERRARAFWLNVYNGLVVHAVVARNVKRSVLLDPGFFRRNAYRVAGVRVSLDDIEHGVLRGNAPHPFLQARAFSGTDVLLRWSLPCDPRVHVALVCAARSCHRLAAYDADRLDEQLEAATSDFVNGGGVTAAGGTLRLSRIFRWYAPDFGGEAGVREFLARYLTSREERRLLESGAPFRYQRWDWRLNGVTAARNARGRLARR